MKFFDLHCDTATEMYNRNLTFESNLHINANSLAGFESATQCFAVFCDDTLHDRDFAYVAAVAEYLKKTAPAVKNLTPILTVEGGDAIGGDLTRLDALKALGVRLFGLSWNGVNALATGNLTSQTAPLTPLGVECVKRLEALDIIPDVSHLSDAGFYGVAENTEKPFVASHSNSRKICPYPRNLTDEQIKILIDRRGLMGLNMCPLFIAENASLSSFFAHIEHILSLGGEDIIALGCDFDGIDDMPSDVTGVESLALFYELLVAEYNEKIADKIFFGNAERVLL